MSLFFSVTEVILVSALRIKCLLNMHTSCSILSLNYVPVSKYRSEYERVKSQDILIWNS